LTVVGHLNQEVMTLGLRHQRDASGPVVEGIFKEGEQQAALFIAAAHWVEQEMPRLPFQGQIAQFVDDQEVRSCEVAHSKVRDGASRAPSGVCNN